MLTHITHGENFTNFHTHRGRLAAPELVQLVEHGVIRGVNPENINAASIDLVLGKKFYRESNPAKGATLITMEKGVEFGPKMTEVFDEIMLYPGERCLAETVETFWLPNTISGELRVRSTAARRGLDHAFASWADAGWHNSVLTLEFVNLNKHHPILLRAGDRCVQMIFEAHSDAKLHSYSEKGRYNNSSTVEQGK